MVCVFGYVLFGEEFLINAIIGGVFGFLIWLFIPSEKEKKDNDVSIVTTNIQSQAKDTGVSKTQASRTPVMHSMTLSIGVMVIAFSMLFHFVISPILKERKLASCLQGIDIQKAEVDAENASMRKEGEDVTSFSDWRDKIANFKSINIKEMQDECYRQSI